MKMEATVKLLVFVSLISLVVSSPIDDEVVFEEIDFHYVEEDSDDPLNTTLEDNEGRSLDPAKVYLRDRKDHVIIEAPGESAKFFEENPPEDSPKGRSGSRPYKQLQLRKDHRGHVRDERGKILIKGTVMDSVLEYIRGRHLHKYPNIMLFPRGARLGCTVPVFITFEVYSVDHCYRPICNPCHPHCATKKTTRKTTMQQTRKTTMRTTRSTQSTRRTTTRSTRKTTVPKTTRCTRRRKICVQIRSQTSTKTPPEFCDPSVSECFSTFEP